MSRFYFVQAGINNGVTPILNYDVSNENNQLTFLTAFITKPTYCTEEFSTAFLLSCSSYFNL